MGLRGRWDGTLSVHLFPLSGTFANTRWCFTNFRRPIWTTSILDIHTVCITWSYSLVLVILLSFKAFLPADFPICQDLDTSYMTLYSLWKFSRLHILCALSVLYYTLIKFFKRLKVKKHFQVIKIYLLCSRKYIFHSFAQLYLILNIWHLLGQHSSLFWRPS